MYNKPKCDCGADLLYWEEVMYEITTPIAKSGALSKRGIQRTTGETGAYERLHCPICSNDYNFKTDSKNRYLRSEKI